MLEPTVQSFLSPKPLSIPMKAGNLTEKDPELAKIAMAAVSDFAEGRGAPPGFEEPVSSALDARAQHADSVPGVQLAEQALEEPRGPPTLAAVASRVNPGLSAPGTPAEASRTPDGECPLTDTSACSCSWSFVIDAEIDAAAAASAKEGTPFGASAVQSVTERSPLPSSPRLPGISTDGLGQPAGSGATQNAMDHRRAFQAVNAETLELAAQKIDYVVPPHKVGTAPFYVNRDADDACLDHDRPARNLSQVQDRTGFLINNLSASNMEQKAKELKELLTEEFWPWFCNYMVVKRAAQEQNFHKLYASLLHALQVSTSCSFASRPKRLS